MRVLKLSHGFVPWGLNMGARVVISIEITSSQRYHMFVVKRDQKY